MLEITFGIELRDQPGAATERSPENGSSDTLK